MKNAMLIYLLAGCLYLFSCTSGKDYPIAMKQAMSCMDARPDSALALLETLADSMSNAPQETQMYYRLLTIKQRTNFICRIPPIPLFFPSLIIIGKG